MAYQLLLPPGWNIHDIFHTSLLSLYTETEQYRPNFSQPPPETIEGKEQYEVEQIVSH
jgi:hypothetical protein